MGVTWVPTLADADALIDKLSPHRFMMEVTVGGKPVLHTLTATNREEAVAMAREWVPVYGDVRIWEEILTADG